jgi:hypothetical protein
VVGIATFLPRELRIKFRQDRVVISPTDLLGRLSESRIYEKRGRDDNRSLRVAGGDKIGFEVQLDGTEKWRSCSWSDCNCLAS